MKKLTSGKELVFFSIAAAQQSCSLTPSSENTFFLAFRQHPFGGSQPPIYLPFTFSFREIST
jgi:hypothetical protein